VASGLARVGLRSSPSAGTVILLKERCVCFLGLLRSPTQDKPARHNSPLVTDVVLADSYAAMTAYL
jgi:hypothetical protein